MNKATEHGANELMMPFQGWCGGSGGEWRVAPYYDVRTYEYYVSLEIRSFFTRRPGSSTPQVCASATSFCTSPW